MRDLDLLVVGDCNPDLVLAGRRVRPEFGQGETWVDRAELVVGGTSSITACGAARLGLRTAMAVRGRRRPVRAVHARRARGVRRGHRAGRRRPGPPHGHLDRPRRARRPGDDDVPGDDRRAAWRTWSATTCCGGPATSTPAAGSSRARAAGTADILRRARAAGATTSLDPGADPDGEWDGGLWTLLPEIDHLLPNAAEARALTGIDDVEAAARRLAAAGTTPVVKCGADGVLAVVDGAVVRAPAIDAEVVDTIGAGDSTDAGWLAGMLNGWPAERSARLAAVCGSLSTRARGGTAAQPTLAEALALL